jgi:hypothetical protein
MSRYVFYIPDEGRGPTGGIMNIVRHCRLACSLGVQGVLATESGNDTHGRKWFKHDMAYIKWNDRKDDDICVIPDYFTDLVAGVHGPCIVYMQSPLWLKQNFDYKRPDLTMWTDSPLMLERCTQLYPGKEIPIVPNIVDSGSFPFIPQSERKDGMVIVFPRKGADFIKSVFSEYRAMGGCYWKPKVVNKMPFEKMILLFHQAQAFLASADVEGCALPPQESMAAGVVVVGRNANGANYCMQHGKTAMVCNYPEGTAAFLLALERSAVRQNLADRAYAFIKRYFPEGEPTRFWKTILANQKWITDPAGFVAA